MSHKAYKREMTRDWFLGHPFYRRYALRELTSVFLLLYSLNLVVGLKALMTGKDAWLLWAQTQSNPIMFVFAIMTLLMTSYHTYTWFNATPKVMPIQKGAKRIPAKTIVNGHWIIFGVISLVILIAAAV